MPIKRNISQPVVIHGQPFIIEKISTSPANKNLEVLYMRKPLGERLWMSSRSKTNKKLCTRPVAIHHWNAR